MRINVSQQLKEPIGSTRTYKVSEIIDVTGDGGGSSMVQGEISLVRTNRGILAKGILHTAVKITCSRCLSLFDCPLALNIEEEYFPIMDVVSGAPASLPGETGGFIIDKHHVLDLTEAIRQNVLLTIPMKPLCHQDCAGLCPGCGHNLNQEPCGCLPQGRDPRWSELSKLASVGDVSADKRKGME